MSARIQKIKDTYSEQFKERLEQEKIDISLDSAWDILISADPSPNKKNVRWLVDTYINNGYLWEDIASGLTSKVSETLTEFDKHKRNLEPADRSLTKYQTLGSLWASIKPYVGQLTPGEEKREERDKAYSEAEVIVDREDGLKIIVPLTEYAAKWFGRGTRWCTSADNDNMFGHYNLHAPLFIIMMPNGDKLQLWKHQHHLQFMDENDDSVTKEYIEQHWKYLKEVLKFSRTLTLYPKQHLDYQICLDAVINEIVALQYVPKEYQDEALCLDAVKTDVSNMRYVELQDKHNFFLKVLKSVPDAISFIPEEMITKELCDITIEGNGSLLYYVPEKYKDYDMCLKAVKQNGLAINYIPYKIKNYELYLESVKNGGIMLNSIPTEYQDYNMCLEAVKKIGKSLIWIPDNMKDYNMCLEAVKQDGDALHNVPEKYKDDNMCSEAIKHNKADFPCIPDNNRGRSHLILDANNAIYLRKQITEMKELFQAPEPALKM